MTTSLHAPISMQITLTPSDLVEARVLLPHQIRVWGNQVDDILVLVDLPPGIRRLSGRSTSWPDSWTSSGRCTRSWTGS